MDSFLVGAQVLLACLFALAGAAKLVDLKASRQAVADFGVPAPLASLAGTLLPIVEVITAAALLVHAWSRWGLALAFVLLLTFCAGVANAMRSGKDVDCGCFGKIYSATAGSGTLVRNALLAALALGVLVLGPAPPIEEWVSESTTVEIVAVLVAPMIILGLALLRWWPPGRDTRPAREALEASAGSSGVDPEGLPVGSFAPSFELPDSMGDIRSLGELVARGLPVVIVFMDRSCAPCRALRPDLARWQAMLSKRVSIAVINAGSAEHNVGIWDGLRVENVLFDDRDEVRRSFHLRATPSALVVGVDGRIRSAPYGGVHGAEVIVRLALSRGIETQRASEPALAITHIEHTTA